MTNRWGRLLAVAVLVVVAGLLVPREATFAQGSVDRGDELLEARVAKILEEEETEMLGQLQYYQKLELVVLTGPRRGERLVVENGVMPQVNPQRYRPGDWVFVRVLGDSSASWPYIIDTYSRWLPLLGVLVLFVLAVVLVVNWRSVTSLLGLAFSFAVLLVYVLPRLAAGAEPVSTVLMGGVAIVPVTYYLAHGLSRKTTVAVAGTAVALLLTVLLTQGAVSLTKLTGYATEEAAYLDLQSSGGFDVRGLLMAGIVVGVLGVLDDVTVAQAAVVEELREANPSLGLWELYRRAMRVGRDHVAGMVNTLALVYTGAALPLLLLLRESPLPLSYMISQEIIAEELVRMLVSSIGLMAAVPVTTVLAAAAVTHMTKEHVGTARVSPDA